MRTFFHLLELRISSWILPNYFACELMEIFLATDIMKKSIRNSNLRSNVSVEKSIGNSNLRSNVSMEYLTKVGFVF